MNWKNFKNWLDQNITESDNLLVKVKANKRNEYGNLSVATLTNVCDSLEATLDNNASYHLFPIFVNKKEFGEIFDYQNCCFGKKSNQEKINKNDYDLLEKLFDEWLIWDWKNLHHDFTKKLVNQWTNNGFTPDQAKEWMDIGLRPIDCYFITYLRDIVAYKPKEVLNFADLETLKNQYQEYLQSEPNQFGEKLTRWEALAVGKIGRRELNAEERKIKSPFSPREIIVDVPLEKLVEELTKKLKLVNDFRNAYNRIEKIRGEREYTWSNKLGSETNFLVMGNIFKYQKHNFPNLGRELTQFVESWIRLRSFAIKVARNETHSIEIVKNESNFKDRKIDNLENEILAEKRKNEELKEVKKKNELLTEELEKHIGDQELVNQVLQEVDRQLAYLNKN